MILTIFHGSNHIIEKPQFGVGKPYNDYGLGFYCTESLDMAKEWGVSKNKDGYENRYTINCHNLSIINLNSPDFTILHWLAVLLENRHFITNAPLALQAKEYILSEFHVDFSSADCIIGYRADDSYFSFAQDFINGTISLRQLSSAMHLGKLGQQFVLKSKKAFEHIHFVDYEIANHDIWYAKRISRDNEARNQYLNTERYRIKAGDIFVTQILSEEMKSDDSRLR